jgi:acyl carrier protein
VEVGEGGKLGESSARARRRSKRVLEFTQRTKPDISGPLTTGRSGPNCNLEETGVSVEEKVIGIVSEQLQVPKEEISAEKSFVDDLKADSLDVVELVMEFEDVFKITIPDEDYEKIKTVGDAVKYIEEKQ